MGAFEYLFIFHRGYYFSEFLFIYDKWDLRHTNIILFVVSSSLLRPFKVKLVIIDC